MKQPKSVLLGWIEAIEKAGRGLTGFEVAFLASVKTQLENGTKLNDVQVHHLEQIHDRTKS